VSHPYSPISQDLAKPVPKLAKRRHPINWLKGKKIPEVMTIGPASTEPDTCHHSLQPVKKRENAQPL
jgi:hypothetical protein